MSTKTNQKPDIEIVQDLPPSTLVDRFDRELANKGDFRFGLPDLAIGKKSDLELKEERIKATTELYLRSPEGRGVMAAKAARTAALDHVMHRMSALQDASELIAGVILGAMKEVEVDVNPATVSYWRHCEMVTTIQPIAKRKHPFRGKFVITADLSSNYTPSVSFHWGWGRRRFITSADIRHEGWMQTFAKELQRWVMARRHSWGY